MQPDSTSEVVCDDVVLDDVSDVLFFLLFLLLLLLLLLLSSSRCGVQELISNCKDLLELRLSEYKRFYGITKLIFTTIFFSYLQLMMQ
jgi:hypothetical protein